MVPVFFVLGYDYAQYEVEEACLREGWILAICTVRGFLEDEQDLGGEYRKYARIIIGLIFVVEETLAVDWSLFVGTTLIVIQFLELKLVAFAAADDIVPRFAAKQVHDSVEERFGVEIKE